MVHNETLFCSPRSSDRKHMNRIFSKFQLFACCFQNFCLYAQCLIMVLLIHMAYERWIHSFIYFRPTVSRNTHKGTSYYYIDFFLTSIKHRTLKEKTQTLAYHFPHIKMPHPRKQFTQRTIQENIKLRVWQVLTREKYSVSSKYIMEDLSHS